MRVLFVSQPGDGHFNPLIPLARALLAAGHEVAVATSPSYVADVERSGLDGIGVGPEWRWDSAIELWPDGVSVSGADSPMFWTQRFNRDITIPFVTALRGVVQDWRPALLVAEFAAAGWAQAVHDFDDIPFVVTAWATEPGSDFVDMDAWGNNAVRATMGLPAIDAFEPTIWIAFTPPSWGALDGSSLRYTRRFRLPHAQSGSPVPGAASHPFVYGTLGTVFNTTRSLLKTFIAAIELGGWAGLVTVGRNNDPARFDHSPAIAVEPYVDQADVLAAADAMICHGGLGSMLGAMEVGCPMVVVPLGGDQLENAARAERLGIARVVDPSEADPRRLTAAIAEVLHSADLRRACDAVRQEIMAMSDVDMLVVELEAIGT